MDVDHPSGVCRRIQHPREVTEAAVPHPPGHFQESTVATRYVPKQPEMIFDEMKKENDRAVISVGGSLL